MKVVLFCGGLGTRLREHSSTIPKPLVTVGPRPIMWHLMQYYARHGHKDFVLCLGYAGEMIREYFLTYNPYLTGDARIGPKGRELLGGESSTADWTITMVDTGLHANLGERLIAVRDQLSDEDVFLANYSDQLSDLNLVAYSKEFLASGAHAGFLSVRPPLSYHYVESKDNGLVDALGGLDAAIAMAKERAKIAKDSGVELVLYPPRKSLYELLSEELSGGGEQAALSAWVSANVSSTELDALRTLRGPLARFRRGEPLALMPFTFLR